MNKISIFFVITLLGLAACSKKFSEQLMQAQQDFKNENYIGVVDTINQSLPFWKESDGKEMRAQAYQLLGQSYQKLRKADKAIEAYSQAIKLSDNTFESAYNLGELYFILGKPNLAAPQYRKALHMKKNDPLALLGLANSYYEMKEYQLAKLNYEMILKVSPGVPEALENLPLAKKKLKFKK